MARTLTAANAVLTLAVDGLFNTPRLIQGFAVDDVFDTENVQTAETMMGVDGRLSAGWVPQPIVQNITLQADSASIDFFERWYAAQQTAREVYIASGSILLRAVNRQYSLTRGFLTGHVVTPAAKKVLQPRRFTLTWESVTAGGLI
jgi:hypothetical protein